MPEAVLMPHAPCSTTVVETSNRIEELREYMDRVNGDLVDGFSDTDSSSDDDSEVQSHTNVTENSSGKGHKAHHKHHKHGHHHIKGTHHHSHNVKHKHHSSDDKKHVTENDNARKATDKDNHNKLNGHENTNKSGEKDSTNVGEKPPENTEDVIDYTQSELEPIIAGQCNEDVNTPIMTPPPTPDPAPKFSFPITMSGFYRRPFSLSFFHAGETLKCGFNDELNESSTENLKGISGSYKTKDCFCSGQFPVDDFVTGWDRPERNGKSKGGKKRKFKNSLTDTPSFLRLTGAQNSNKDDPLSFHYFEDSKKYIERYRFIHTVGDVCRPQSERVKEIVPVKKDIDNEPYFKNLKSQCAMATECDLYSLISHAKLKKPVTKQEAKRPASAKSNTSGHEKNKSEDEDSVEEGNIETKPFSMRDRGKTLNLAPVRECMVPDLVPTDKFEQYQQNYMELNQYLNLMTPPAPGKELQFRLDILREKRFASRILNSGDNNLFPACSPRRGARPLRLGSAEFVKPGSGETEPKWSNDVKPHFSQPIQRASTFHSVNGNTVPGNLIVGSTVNQSKHSAKIRTKHGGKSSPYVTFSKEQSAHFSSQKPQTPPHHISGKRFKPCERVNDLASSKEKLGRIPFTTNNNEAGDKMISPCRTVMAVDLKEAAGFKREKLKQITLDVNHLGIRGKTFQQDGQITILYKDRQTATVKS